MSEIVSKPRDHSKAQPKAEFGDVKGVKETFGWGETFTYNAWRAGKIKGVLVPGRGRTRGKRVFSYDSIREHLRQCQSAENETLPRKASRSRRKAKSVERLRRE